MKKRSFEVLCHKKIRNARSKDVRTGRSDTPSDGGGKSLDRGARHMSSWGIWMELLRIAWRRGTFSHPEFRPSTFSHSEFRPSTFSHSEFRPPTFSHPEFRPLTFHIRNSVRRHFTAGWERRTFQLLRSDLSGSSDSAY
uniref:Uncharacterized protein n=1 Tax=Vitis vinifera TaxID=29760 RepID=A5BH32_VITVI|nr:hypothetical protein VITISV_009764 [Vitis vinifera]